MPAPLVPGTPAAPAQKPNGAPAAPAAPAQPDLAAQLAQTQKERDEYKAKVDSADKKLRVNAIEMMKFSDEKKGLGAKLSEHSAFDGAFKAAGLTPADLRNFKVNPEPVLKKVFGDGWYDRIVEMRLNGGAPTAEAVAAEIARAKDEVRADLKADAEKEKAETARKQQEAAAAARAELTSDATAFLEKSWGDYPIFEGYDRPGVARAIAQYQEQQWQKTGKVLTTKEAADALEAAEISRAERVAGIPKYATKLTEKLKPATVPPAGGSRSAGNTQTERRTLSNDLTATSQAKRQPRTDEERRAAILALDLGK